MRRVTSCPGSRTVLPDMSQGTHPLAKRIPLDRGLNAGVTLIGIGSTWNPGSHLGMPTRNPRINVTVSGPQYELLSRLARVQGRSRSAVLLDLFETVTPVLERVCVVAEAAERAQSQAKEGLQAAAERAEAALSPLLAKAMGQLDLLVEDSVKRFKGHGPAGGAPAERARSARPRGSRTPGKSPRPVIRGPGRGAKGPGGRTSKGGRS